MMRCAVTALIGLAALTAGTMAAGTMATAEETLDDVIRRLLAEDPPSRPARPTSPREVADLNGLDSFSGHVTRFAVPVDGEGAFERMQVRVLACHEVDGGVDAYAFLEITDTKTPDTPAFRGWMIASSPALSSLDHPRYDIWLHACSTASGDAS